MAKEIKGIAASNGVAIAKAYKLVDPDLSFDTRTVDRCVKLRQDSCRSGALKAC
ncbi:MAG: hypothetical protein ACLT1C_08350 [Weissella confusa]